VDAGGGDAGTDPSDGPTVPDTRNLAISGGCSAAGTGGGESLLALVLLTLLTFRIERPRPSRHGGELD
jgi:MYXO-CTERM domain-containing protein